MTHPKQDIKLVEILQASYEQVDVTLCNLLTYTIQGVQEKEITSLLNAN